MTEAQIRANIVAFAKKHVGATIPKGDDKFIDFYNKLTGNDFPLNGTAWCAIFATYTMRHNEVPLTAVPNFHSCTWLRNKFLVPHKRWRPAKGYTPKPGDLILFNWHGQSDVLNHVGIVERVTSTTVYTIEGNAGQVSGVRNKSYALKSPYVIGYGEPDFSDMLEYGGEIDPEIPVVADSLIKNVQKWMNGFQGISIAVDGSFGPFTKIAAIKVLQTILNRDYGAKLVIDGSFGPATKAAFVNASCKRGMKTDIVMLAQGLLYARYANPQGFDGMFGPGMQYCVKEFQKTNGLVVDGSVGPDTMEKLCTKW